jgi:hypothetical protein
MTLSPQNARRALAAAALCATTGLVAACGSASPSAAPAPHASPAHHTAHPAKTGGTHAAAPTPASTPATGSTGSTGTQTGAQTGSQTGTTTTASGVPACTTQDLRVNADASQGWKGMVYDDVDFINRTSQPCTLYGYPGISFVTATGQLLGEPAVELPNPPRTLQTVDPGHSVFAFLEIKDTSEMFPQQCGPVDSAYLRVYPPNQAAPILVPWTMQVCSGPLAQLSVEAVQG